MPEDEGYVLGGVDSTAGSDDDTAGELETPKDAGKGGAGVVRRWLMEIDASTKSEKDWRQTSLDIIERYRAYGSESDGKRRQFNILYSNTEVIRSAIYNSTPIPDVRRRFRDEDPVGKAVAETLQRALSFAIEQTNFDMVMDCASLDYLLQGRAVTRVRWVPQVETKVERIEVEPERRITPEGETIEILPEDFEEDEQGRFQNGEEFDEKVFEEVVLEPVVWDDFRMGSGRKWDEVTWIAFQHKLTKDQLKELFGDAGNKVKMDVETNDSIAEDESDPRIIDVFKRGRVWEVWDKDTRQVLFIAPSHKEGPIKVEDDPLNLRDFFPIPQPLYAMNSTDTLLPVSEFLVYKDQADELDDITHRISRLISGMKVRGIYDSSVSEFDQLFSSDDNAMIPSDQGGMALQAGGMDRAIWFMPIGEMGSVLAGLYQQRNVLRDTIFEVTGISDIIRGASRASETATAQNIKARFGGMRLDRRVRAIADYSKNLIRLMAEVISEYFDPETIQLMTGTEVTPEMMQLMRDDAIRNFRIDIETDSTIAASENADQEAITKLLGALTQFIGGLTPLVASGQLPMQAAKSILLGAMRKFKMGREVEDAIQTIGTEQQQQGQQQPDPETVKMQAEMQMEQAKMQMEQQKMQMDMQFKQAELEQKMALEREKLAQEMQIEREKLQVESQTDLKVAEIKADASNSAEFEFTSGGVDGG